MIGLSKLITGRSTPADRLRYGGPGVVNHAFDSPTGHRPVVVWNITDMCNLACEHCYYSAVIGKRPVHMTLDVIRRTVDDLAEAGVPVLLFSGGEPLVHPNIYEAIEYTAERGIKPVLSSNGTNITPAKAARLVSSGLEYVGISLDGAEETHNTFRRHPTAFARAVAGMRAAVDAGMRVSVRFTLTESNHGDLDDVIKTAEEVGAHRLCVYHLVPSGRARRDGDIDNVVRRGIIERLCNIVETTDLEILTVDNPSDGPLALLWAREHRPERVADMLDMLTMRTPADGTGRRIVEIDHRGDVHPNQFWLDHTCGNILEESFSTIWNRESGLLHELRADSWPLEGACEGCSFRQMCGGFRARASRFHGSPWGDDPSCSLTAAERSSHVLVPEMSS